MLVTSMRLILMVFIVSLVTGCSSVSDQDKSFFYSGWVHPKTSEETAPVPPQGYYDKLH